MKTIYQHVESYGIAYITIGLMASPLWFGFFHNL